MTHKLASLVLVSLMAASSACMGGAGGGGLTVAQLEEAQTKVHAMQPKAAALEALTPLLGPPTSQDESAMVWMAKDGDGCKALTVGLMGDAVGTVGLATAACQ